MTSPLGKYGQVVAAIVAVGTIGAYVAVIVIGALLGIDTERPTAALRDFALFSIGAVFGAQAAVNGVKAPITAAHDRIDKLETATGVPTHGAYPVPPIDDVDRAGRRSDH